MLNIKIPVNFVAEREYVIKVILHFILGVEYQVEVSDVNDYELSIGDKMVIIRDHFWKKIKRGSSYVNIEFLPKVFFLHSCYCLDSKGIPVLYGNDEFVHAEDKIVCGVDIFASSFFMLTRWEEYRDISRKDMHGRVLGKYSTAYRYKFLDRPIVNEYALLLLQLFKELGVSIPHKCTYQYVNTHDVDIISSKNTLRLMAGDILKRRNVYSAIKRIQYLFNDPVNSFKFISDINKRYGIISHFFIMSIIKSTSKYDTKYYLSSRKFKGVYGEISVSNHIGFHPSYNSYLNKDKWSDEFSRVKPFLSHDIIESRQHYLRIQLPNTIDILQSNGVGIDYSLGYHDMDGFRCGTGDLYPLFNCLTHKMYNVFESPLIVMDSTINCYRKLSVDGARNVMCNYIDMAKRMGMRLTFLFHNSSFDDCEWSGWKDLYEYIIQYSI